MPTTNKPEKKNNLTQDTEDIELRTKTQGNQQEENAHCLARSRVQSCYSHWTSPQFVMQALGRRAFPQGSHGACYIFNITVRHLCLRDQPHLCVTVTVKSCISLLNFSVPIILHC